MQKSRYIENLIFPIFSDTIFAAQVLNTFSKSPLTIPTDHSEQSNSDTPVQNNDQFAMKDLMGTSV